MHHLRRRSCTRENTLDRYFRERERGLIVGREREREGEKKGGERREKKMKEKGRVLEEETDLRLR